MINIQIEKEMNKSLVCCSNLLFCKLKQNKTDNSREDHHVYKKITLTEFSKFLQEEKETRGRKIL